MKDAQGSLAEANSAANDAHVLAKRKRRRTRQSREQPPPAPKVTTQLILAERLSPKDPEEPNFVLDDPDSSSGDSAQSPGENFFEKAFDECLYDDLQDLSREALIERIRTRDRELEQLRMEVQALKEGSRMSSESSI